MSFCFPHSEVPVFPDHFSIGSARPNLECNAINQSRDAEWGTRFLCYKPTLQRLNITWSQNGPITGLDCINTVMPFENAAELWNTSYLCVSRNSLLKFRWSVSRPIRGLGCLEVRERKRTRKGYFLCGVPRHKKIGKIWFVLPWKLIAGSRTSKLKPCAVNPPAPSSLQEPQEENRRPNRITLNFLVIKHFT